MLSAPSVKYSQVMWEQHLWLKQELQQEWKKMESSVYSSGAEALQKEPFKSREQNPLAKGLLEISSVWTTGSQKISAEHTAPPGVGSVCQKPPWLLAPDSSFPTLPITKTVQGAIPSKWLQTAVNTQHVPHWQPFPKKVIGNPPPFKTVSAAIQELLYPYLVPNTFTWLIKNLRGMWNEC